MVGCLSTGSKGEDDNGIKQIEKTSTSVNVDTSEFVVNGTNGEQGIQGIPGQYGHTPVITIGSNGNWHVDGVDTGVYAQGEKGDKGDKGDTGAQ